MKKSLIDQSKTFYQSGKKAKAKSPLKQKLANL